MVRFGILFLVLSLLAPITAATPPSEHHNPFAGLFDPLWSLLNWAFSWITPDKHSGFIVPNGVTAPPLPTENSGAYIVPSGATILVVSAEKSGAYIVPNG